MLEPPIVASKRLPASRVAQLSIGWPLYQRRAWPEFLVLPEQALRASSLIWRLSPDTIWTGAVSVSGTLACLWLGESSCEVVDGALVFLGGSEGFIGSRSECAPRKA